MSNIAICTDLFESSDPNVLSGFKFAKKFKMTPALYHVDETTPYIRKMFHPASVDTVYAKDKTWGKYFQLNTLQKLEQQLERINLSKRSFVEFENFEGPFDDAIRNLRENDDIEALAIGHKPHSFLHRLLFKSFLEKTFFQSEKDILCIKSDNSNIDKILYILPYANYNKSDLDKVYNMAINLGAKVHLECIFPLFYIGFDLEPSARELIPSDEYMIEIEKYYLIAEQQLDKAKEYLQQLGLNCSTSKELVLKSDPSEIMKILESKLNFNFVVMKPQRFSFDKHTIGTTALNIIEKINSNVYLISDR